jgi:hypothetical protein
MCGMKMGAMCCAAGCWLQSSSKCHDSAVCITPLLFRQES